MLNVYTFTDSDTVLFTEDPKYKVTAIIKPNSITLEHLSLPIVSEIEGYAKAAAASATAAAGSAANAETSATNASVFMVSAEEFRDEAITAKNAAETAQTGARTAEINAAASSSTATQKATAATQEALLSQSYARGETGTRTGEDTDNAKYYMEQAQIAAMQASGFDYEGAWDSSKVYTPAQIVSYDATVWVSKTNNVNSMHYEGSPDWSIFIGVPSVLDLGSFTDDTLVAHIANLNSHSTMTIDANNAAITTEETLEEHEVSVTAHGNINIDGGEI